MRRQATTAKNFPASLASEYAKDRFDLFQVFMKEGEDWGKVKAEVERRIEKKREILKDCLEYGGLTTAFFTNTYVCTYVVL